MPPPPLPSLSQQQLQGQPHLYGGHQGSSSSSSSVPPSSWMYANRDSVRESWFSSGSSSVDHHQLQQHGLYHGHHHSRARQQPQVSSGGTSDASNKSIASSQHNFSRSSQTLPRNTVIYFLMFILSFLGLALKTFFCLQQSCLKHHQQVKQGQEKRSMSRESGSSSSRTISRSESRPGKSSRSGSSSALQRPRTPEGSGTLFEDFFIAASFLV